MQFWKSLRFIFVLSLFAGGSLAQQRPLSLSDMETLLQNGVSQERIVKVLEERGVNFDAGVEARVKLRKAGASGRVMDAVEKASLEFVRKSREAQKTAEAKQMEEKRKIAEETRKREQEAAKRAEAETKRKQEQAKQKEEEMRSLEEARRKAEEERRRIIEETRKREEEAARRAQAEKLMQQEEEEKEKLAEAKRKAEEEKRQLEEARRQAEEKKRIEETRKRALEQVEARRLQETKRTETDDKMPVALAPPCTIGLRHQFQYEDGTQFSRQVSRRDGELCVIDRNYYNKDWVLVKQIATDGREITASQPDYPLVGEKWLAFPISVGKEWEINYRARYPRRAGVGYYHNFFKVVSYEKVGVKAGAFVAFKIRQEQRQLNNWGVRYFWYVPEVEYYVKHQVARNESKTPSYWLDQQDYELTSISRPK